MYAKFLQLARDHYWDSLEPHKELILFHLEGIIAACRTTRKRKAPVKAVRIGSSSPGLFCDECHKYVGLRRVCPYCKARRSK